MQIVLIFFYANFQQQQPKELSRVKIKDLPPSKSVSISPIPSSSSIPLAPTEEDFDHEDESVFQFSPEFHRVPSPMLNKPHVTFIPAVGQKLDQLPNDPPHSRRHEEGHQSVAPEEVEIPSKDNANVDKPPPSPPTVSRSNIVSARAKFFEQEIQHHQAAPSKSSNLFFDCKIIYHIFNASCIPYKTWIIIFYFQPTSFHF